MREVNEKQQDKTTMASAGLSKTFKRDVNRDALAPMGTVSCAETSGTESRRPSLHERKA